MMMTMMMMKTSLASGLSLTSGYATWFTAGGALRITLRQLCKTGNYVIYDVIIWVQDGNCKKWL